MAISELTGRRAKVKGQAMKDGDGCNSLGDGKNTGKTYGTQPFSAWHTSQTESTKAAGPPPTGQQC